MTKRTEREIDALLDEVRAEYEDEDRAAAEEEAREREERDRAASVYSVRLPRDVYDAVREAAERAHLTPSALIRQWISERVCTGEQPEDLVEAVANLRRDVEWIARLARPA